MSCVALLGAVLMAWSSWIHHGDPSADLLFVARTKAAAAYPAALDDGDGAAGAGSGGDAADAEQAAATRDTEKQPLLGGDGQ